MTTGMHSGDAIGVPLTGVLFEGRCVRAGWPEAAEFDAITELRNRPAVRRQFLDSRPLDPVRNRQWLSAGMRRPHEALLSVRIKVNDVFVGTIGWSHWNPTDASFEIGRLMVDARVLARHRDQFPADYAGVAVDVGMALRDYAFGTLGLRRMHSVFIEDNSLARRTNLLGGGRVVETSLAQCVDGRQVALVHVEFDRDVWAKEATSPVPAPTSSKIGDSAAGAAVQV